MFFLSTLLWSWKSHQTFRVPLWYINSIIYFTGMRLYPHYESRKETNLKYNPSLRALLWWTDAEIKGNKRTMILLWQSEAGKLAYTLKSPLREIAKVDLRPFPRGRAGARGWGPSKPGNAPIQHVRVKPSAARQGKLSPRSRMESSQWKDEVGPPAERFSIFVFLKCHV